MKLFFTLIFSILFSIFSFGKSIEGKVTKVSDGDTITILQNNKKVRVRLYGIDAPETKQDYGIKSLSVLKDLVDKKNVKIEIKDKDQYGRIVGVVFLDDLNINQYMLETGNAWWYKTYAKNEKGFENAVKEAQRKKLGVWGMKNPMAPWTFRRKNRKK